MDPPSFLQDGDNVSCEIERIGRLTNFVRDVSEVTSVARQGTGSQGSKFDHR
jgi:hypothetical protein